MFPVPATTPALPVPLCLPRVSLSCLAGNDPQRAIRITTPAVNASSGQGEAKDQAGRDKATLQALALTPDTDGAVPEAVEDAAEYNQVKQDEIDDRASERIPDEDPDYEDIGPAWQTLVERERDAVIQPPQLVVPPSEQVAVREKQPEAGG